MPGVQSAGGDEALPVQELLARGRAALRAGDAEGARRFLEPALAGSSPGHAGDVLEGLARASYLEFDFLPAVAAWERAYSAHRDAGDRIGAVRVARTLACMYLTVLGEGAVGRGWLSRAQTLLTDQPDSPEAGWVALDRGMFEGDRARKEEHFRTALATARRTGDPDLELVSLAYLGASFVYGDRVEEGMVLLDEALAAVAGGEVDDFCVLEEIFCQLFSACERAHDVTRADQWIRVGDAIAERRHLPVVSAFCRTHYGAILTAAGRWAEADEALTEAVRLWGLGQRALRVDALVRLADLRVRQGRLEEAEQLLEGLDVNTEAARPLAAIHLARGDVSLAADVLEHGLGRTGAADTSAAPLLALLVDVHLAGNRVEEARAVADRLAAAAARCPAHYLLGAAALARGRVFLAAGTGDARTCLREALGHFAQAQMPMEVARSRLSLAQAAVAEHPEVAVAEARAALEAFERLRAARHVDAAADVLRTFGVRSASTARRADTLLTKREGEILDLLGHGLSNPQMAARLYISRKTVEHHVGNILAKLGLRSRGEATAYAVRTRPGTE